MNRFHFTKMHGLGNDVVVIDGIRQSISLDAREIQCLGDRHKGIGFDQFLLVAPSENSNADFAVQIYNADGQAVGQCGNGLRCVARFVRDRGLTQRDEITFSVRDRLMLTRLESDGQVAVDMGLPALEPAAIPFEAECQAKRYALSVNDETVEFGAVGLGNPHAVIQVADVQVAPVTRLGPLLERHARFPERANVGFMEVVDSRHIRLRVFERGVGETLACGSGACAAVVVGHQWGQLGDEVEVALPGGRLLIRRLGQEGVIWMTGPVGWAFDGVTGED